MKLYIPSSTLNISNMLSTGSISPISYYEKRGFGIKWFEDVCGCSTLTDTIVLFEKYPLFGINSDKESYPMVIELEMRKEKLIKSNIDGVYYMCQTIYFSPSNIIFYFNSETDKKKAELRIEQSDEAKFFSLYKSSLRVKGDKTETIELNLHELQNIRIEEIYNIQQEINKDYLYDKLRGIFCGFYIGANGFYNSSTSRGTFMLRIRNAFNQVLSLFKAGDELYKDACILQQKAYRKCVNYENLDNFFNVDGDCIAFLPQEEDYTHQYFYAKLLEWLINTKKDISQQYASTEGGGNY